MHGWLLLVWVQGLTQAAFLAAGKFADVAEQRGGLGTDTTVLR